MNTLFLIGAGIFALSSTYFLLRDYKTDAHSTNFRAAFFVSAITLISYLMMWSGSWLVEVMGEIVYYTRWLGYALSCSLLMFSIGKMTDRTPMQIANMMGLTVLVMVTGALAAIFSGSALFWVFFVVSSLFYVPLVVPLLWGEETNRIVRAFVLIGWNLFPVVFLLSAAGWGIISTGVATGMYLLLDVFTKILFYLVPQK